MSNVVTVGEGLGLEFGLGFILLGHGASAKVYNMGTQSRQTGRQCVMELSQSFQPNQVLDTGIYN